MYYHYLARWQQATCNTIKGIAFYSSFIKSIAKWYERVFSFFSSARWTYSLFLFHIPLLLFVFSKHLYSLRSFLCSFIHSLAHTLIHLVQQPQHRTQKIERGRCRKREKKKVVHFSQNIMLRAFCNKVRSYLITSSFACYNWCTREIKKKNSWVEEKNLGTCMLFDLKLFAHSHCE